MRVIWTSFLTVVLFLNGEFQVFAGNLSGAANNDSQTINLVLPENGGKFENELSDYTKRRGYGVLNLTNGVTKENGWSSERKPTTPQEFVYSFKDGNTALLDNVVIAAKGKYSSKDVEVLISTNGSDFSPVASGKLPRNSKLPVTLNMDSVQAAYVKLVIKSGHHSKYWQLAEFVVNGTFAEVEVPTNLVSPENGGKFENELSDYTKRRGYGVVNLTNGVTKEDGWSSKHKPTTPQKFVYSFKDGNTALLDNVVIHGVKAAKGKYSSKDVEVLISTNGSDFSLVASGKLPRKGKHPITLNMDSVQAAYVKLVIKSGYHSKYWQLAEFVVNGTFADTNLPPIANAGPDQTTSPEITVFLDGSRSSDPEGDPLAYSWSLTAPNSSNASLSDVSQVNPSFKVDVPGEYEAELIVNDGFSDSAPDQVLISIENTPPVADAGPDQAASINQLIQLDGSDSSDVDGDLLDFSWSLTVPEGSSATLSNADSVFTDFMVDVPGDYEAELVVNDGNMNGNSEPDSVLITTENSPPVVDAGLDQVAVIGETIQLDGSGSGDVDGDSLNYFWSLPSVPNGSSAVLSNVEKVNSSFIVDKRGTYVAQVIVDDGELESTWDTAVISTENSRPVADPGLDQTANVGDTIQLDGSGSFDADGDTLGYFWSLIVKPETSMAELSDPDATGSTFTADQTGIYIAQLIVADDFLESEPGTVVFTISNDVDEDYMEDTWERQYFGSLAEEASTDFDSDGISNIFEYNHGTDPTDADTDGDGLSDGDEVDQHGTDPLNADTDGDGYSDSDEYYAGTNATDFSDAPESAGVEPWNIADVGNVSGAKGYTVDGRYVLHAKGSGVSPDDKLGFFYQEFIGDFEIAMRAYSVEGGITGLMARSTLDDSDLMVTGFAQQRGYKFHARSTVGTQPSSFYLGGKHFPNTYIKLKRTGSCFAAYRSTDGDNWSPMGNLTLNAGSSMLAGIVLASGPNSELCKAEVEVISVVRDSDSDGISDSEEALYGTLADDADTDGDGVSDYDELFVIFSNPLVADFDGTETVVTNISGSAFTDSLGNWQREAAIVYAREQRGWVEYILNIQETGGFRFDVIGGQNNAYSGERHFDLVLYVDGQRVDSSYLEAGYGESDAASFFLPQLLAGNHTFRIEWLNGAPGTSLRLDSVSLASLGGEDADGNGIFDWLDSRLAATSDFDETTVHTSISPYTLEGSATHINFVSVTSDYEPNPAEPETISVQQGLQGDYFAHIDLAPDADTTVSVSEQSGLINFDKTVIWTPLNLLDSEDLLIRAGDSLLLSAFTSKYQTDEAVSIIVSNSSTTETYSLTAAEATQYEFATAGSYTLTATLTPNSGDPISAEVTVEIVGISFGTAPRVVVGDTRDWTVPGVTGEAFLEADNFIDFSEKSPVDGSRRFSLSTNSTAEGTILARLDEDGPILGRTTLYPLVNYHYTETRWSIVGTFEDGTEVWSASINLGGDVPDDIEVHIRIIKAGVTFLDGSVETTITKNELDEFGVFRYYMLRSPESIGSTCHITTVNQDGELIGAY